MGNYVCMCVCVCVLVCLYACIYDTFTYVNTTVQLRASVHTMSDH